MKCFKLHGLLPLFLLLFVFLCPTVRAIENYPKMTESQANQIIEYMTNDTSWTNYRINSNDYVSTSELINSLILQNSQELADIFNLCIANYSGDVELNWNNINLIIAKGNNSTNNHCFTYSFVISNYDINEENNLDFIRYQQAPAFTRFFNSQVYENKKCYYFQIRFEWQNNIGDFFVENEIQELTLNNSIRIYPKQNPTISNNNVSFISLINLGIQNNPIYYTQQLNGYYLNIKNLEFENQKSYIEDNTSGDNGYIYNNDGVTTLDLNGYTQNIKNDFFIGKNLNFTNEYYYYNESGEKTICNDLITLYKWDFPSGEPTGTFYYGRTNWIRYRNYYPYNIYQSLIVKYQSGEEILEEKTVVDDLLVINWSDSSISGDIIGTTTGTITNSSGDVIGNYSGETKIGEINENELKETEKETIQNIYENISGELNKNEALQTLEEAEKGIQNIFLYGKNNPQLLDFIITWGDIKYKDKTIIQAGQINFSEYCREIPELGTIQNYIRIIACFWASWAILKQIYNLILSTLGIDNPYLYENEHKVTAIDGDTGEYRTMYYRNRRVIKK